MVNYFNLKQFNKINFSGAHCVKLSPCHWKDRQCWVTGWHQYSDWGGVRWLWWWWWWWGDGSEMRGEESNLLYCKTTLCSAVVTEPAWALPGLLLPLCDLSQ